MITAWSVFEHLHDPAAAFARVAELLRSGGRFILLVPNLRHRREVRSVGGHPPSSLLLSTRALSGNTGSRSL